MADTRANWRADRRVESCKLRTVNTIGGIGMGVDVGVEIKSVGRRGAVCNTFDEMLCVRCRPQSRDANCEL